MNDVDDILATIDSWGADHAAVVVLRTGGRAVVRGDSGHRFRWASVTKLVTALTVLVAVERGLIDLDEPAGPPDSTVRHLLAHASGLPFEGETTLAAPGARRIYSNPGFDLLGAIVGERTGRSFEATLREWILAPLRMDGAQFVERPSQGLVGSIGDLAALAAELQHPTVVSADTLRTATAVAFPGLIGVVPGLGRFDPCGWGLGPELHDGKAPHWMGARNSAATFGHFGGAGTFLWVDPEAGLVVGALSDREFGPWARIVWPAFSDALLAADR